MKDWHLRWDFCLTGNREELLLGDHLVGTYSKKQARSYNLANSVEPLEGQAATIPNHTRLSRILALKAMPLREIGKRSDPCTLLSSLFAGWLSDRGPLSQLHSLVHWASQSLWRQHHPYLNTTLESHDGGVLGSGPEPNQVEKHVPESLSACPPPPSVTLCLAQKT